MTLLPSLRQKKRYILFAVLAEKQFSALEIKEEVEKALHSFLGELGVAKAAPWFVAERFDLPKQQFVLKVEHTFVDEVKSALILIKKIKNTPILLRSIIVSGTLKKIGDHGKSLPAH